MAKLYGARAAAAFLGISHQMARRLCLSGELKAQKVDEVGYVIEERDLKAYRARRDRRERLEVERRQARSIGDVA